MSIRVEGVIDLPHVDLKDLGTLYELFLFLQENNISVGSFNPAEWFYILKDRKKALEFEKKFFIKRGL
ncbi:MAG: hypothetical protein P3W91_000635 [Fervidobacterium sp.]|nr:hypothetical protein [Fervidobacterium sp.]